MLPLDLAHAVQAPEDVEQLVGPIVGPQLDHQHDPVLVPARLPVQPAQLRSLARTASRIRSTSNPGRVASTNSSRDTPQRYSVALTRRSPTRVPTTSPAPPTPST